MHVNDAPGLGVEVDEEAAAKYPLPKFDYEWTQVRKRDGTAIRP
jgi:mannonate dehydratase